MPRTAGATSWLGAARRKSRTKRPAFDKASWQFQRVTKFKQSVRFAAAARATRLVLNVTQAEVAGYYNVSQSTVCQWESGKYFGWDPEELAEYQNTCQRLARRTR